MVLSNRSGCPSGRSTQNTFHFSQLHYITVWAEMENIKSKRGFMKKSFDVFGLRVWREVKIVSQ